MSSFKIGLDFDNTLVCYDGVFHRAAMDRGLVPAGLATDKGSIRDYLRAQGREDDWTELQGYVYGRRMGDARLFAGVETFLEECRTAGVQTCIISHKTRTPYRGPAYDLHAAARQWIADTGLLEFIDGGADAIWFEQTLKDKLQRIATAGCRVFIDDLPECLRDPDFPPGVEGLLFDPDERHLGEADLRRAGSWRELSGMMRVMR